MWSEASICMLHHVFPFMAPLHDRISHHHMARAPLQEK